MLETPDEIARRPIVERLDDNLFVEAGAGTGKTRALVDRVIALIEAGRDIEEIVVITFTEKAAAELRDRVRHELEKRPGAAAAAAVERLETAPISTIHSFCVRVLREFGAVAGVDPGFEVADEIEHELRFVESYRAFVEGPASPAISRLLALGMWPAQVRQLAASFVAAPGDSRASIPAASVPPSWPNLVERPDALTDLLRGVLDPSDRLIPPVRALVAILRELRAADIADRDAALAEFATEVGGLSFGSGRKENWPGTIESVRRAAREIQAALLGYLKAQREEALRGAIPAFAELAADEDRRRQAEGRLSYDDLIRHTRDLLVGSPGARRAVRERFRTVLIDEFQDTDPMQAEIVLAFAEDEAGGLEPGRLFVVGDPKQSIYRFRRADMESYAAVRRRMVTDGAAEVTLSENRRSTVDVIEPVNAAFGLLIGGGQEGIQPAYRPITPRRRPGLRGPGVSSVGGPVDGTAAAARLTEAADIADRILEAVAGGWEVQDRVGDTFVTRVARPRDIAVLMPARTGLTALERALERRAIPYRVEGGTLLFRTQELRDITNALTAIDDPSDSVAVVGALRSVLFACSDADLAAYVSATGRIDYLRIPPDASGPVAAALAVLRDYHLSRHEGSLAALVGRFVRERGLAEVDLLDTGSRNGFRRGRYLVEQARAFEAREPRSLRAFVEWLRRRAAAAVVDEEGTALDDDEDAVRVLTIHGAKGLEFPIVFLVGLGGSPRADLPVLHKAHDGLMVVGVGPKSTAARFELGDGQAAAERELAHVEAERRRLLYVAATRARDHLIVSLYRGNRQGAGSSAALMEAALDAPSLPALGQPAALTRTARPVARSDDAPASLARRTHVVEQARRRLTSATALGREQQEEEPIEPWTRGRARTRVGRAVHAAIQSLPWEAEAALIESAARAQAVAEAVPDRWREVAELTRAALNSAAAGRARGASRALREVPFAVEIGGGLVEGFIDLVIESAGGIEVVDWKTDAVRPDEVLGRLEDYRLQAGLYALALETVTGKRPARITYVFAGAGVEESPGEPGELIEYARARLERGELTDAG